KFWLMGIAMILGIAVVGALIGGMAAAAVSSGSSSIAAMLPILAILFPILYIGGFVCMIMSYFKMRTSIANYYNTVEPIGLKLSPIMTFFFNILYFQYHFQRIA